MEPGRCSEPCARRFEGDDGASLVEYALLVSLITLVCAAAVGFFQDATNRTLARSAEEIEQAGE